MNRILTTLVQLFLVGGAWVCVAMMWQDIKHDIKEMRDEFKK